ncbi:MAG TPA: PAS domain S-box protein [Burkholderiales bacterium]|jgi:PAS domain S-box-containing protein
MAETRLREGAVPVSGTYRFEVALLLAALAAVILSLACALAELMDREAAVGAQAATLAVAACCVLFAGWRARRLWRRVTSLREGLVRLARGDFSSRLTEADGQLDALARDFNRTAEALQSREEAAVRSGERFSRLAAMTSDWFWELDAGLRFAESDGGLQLGPAARAVTRELLGTHPWDHAWLRPLDIGWEAHRAHLSARQPFSLFLVERVLEGRASRVMALRGEPVFAADGGFLGYRGIGSDITRRYRAEQALRESEARNRALTDHAPEAIFVVDASTLKVLTANPSAARMFGMPLEALLTAPIDRFNASVQPGGDGPGYGRALMEQALSGAEVTVEWHFHAADGRAFPAELRMARISGVAPLLRLSVIDISERRLLETERERLQAQSRRLLKRLHQIIETMPLACIVYAPDFVVQTWNPAAERVFGFTADEAVGHDLLGLVVPPERHADVRERLVHRLGGVGLPAGRRVVNLTRDGRRIGCEWFGALIPAEGEDAAAVVIMAMDVSDKMEAEAALQQSEARYRSLVEGAQAGVFVYRDDLIEYVNPAMVALMRAPNADTLIGYNVAGLIAPEFSALARGRRLAMAAGLPGARFIEMQLLRTDGTRIDVEVGSSVVSRERGLVIQAQVHDVSARKWTEREIMRLNESLEARVAERTAELSTANREMESFSYTVAHDLRAPLRAIDGFARMLHLDAAERLDARMRRDLDMISSNARRMAELIDGLLEFSRFSRGEPDSQNVGTAAMVRAVIQEAVGAPGGVRPEFSVGALPDVRGDAAMLRQVWVNLISNAVKFTAGRSDGRVVIEARAESGAVCFSVRDNGAGFDPAYADKLFGMFQRLHRQEEFEGTGVGLAIVKRVIERHGGKVWAEGRPGEGASFHFRLPAEHGAVGQASAGPSG